MLANVLLNARMEMSYPREAQINLDENFHNKCEMHKILFQYLQ